MSSEDGEPLQAGLAIEFEKFGKAATRPLLELLRNGDRLVAARAAQILSQSDFIEPSDYRLIHAAWWRSPGTWTSMLASQHPTPEFVREVIARLRKEPIADGDLASLFSNFREFDFAKSNDVTATITEHIECSKGEPCDLAFAKLQFGWINSNVMQIGTVGARMAEAIRNPSLDVAARLAALSFFRSSQYGRPRDEMREISLPVLREQIDSSNPEIRFEAARILNSYGDKSSIGILFEFAEAKSSSHRTEALATLADIGKELKIYAPRVKELLADPDWDVRRHAVIVLGSIGAEESIDDLVNQIASRDWLVSYSAVSALKTFSSERAARTLQKVAESYWHPVVRDAAAKKQVDGPNLAQYSGAERPAVQLADRAIQSMKFPDFDLQDYQINQWCKARFERDGYRFVPDFITGPEVIEQANQASQHNFDHFTQSLLGHESMKGAVQPSLSMEVAGWNFVGTASERNSYGADDHETPGQLVVGGHGRSPQVILTQNIAAAFVWQGKPYAITAGTGIYSRGDGSLYQLLQREDQRWAAEPVLRLTGLPASWQTLERKTSDARSARVVVVPQVWLAPDGTIGILGTRGAMLIDRDLSPRWVGCPQPSFP